MRRAAATVLLVAVLAVLGAGSARAGEAFFEGIEDLPLMPGLAEVPDAAVVFENPEGRLVTAVAVGRLAEDAVWRYYRSALPALGWRPAGAGRFVREGEALRLEVAGREGGIEVRFALAPDRDEAERGRPK